MDRLPPLPRAHLRSKRPTVTCKSKASCCRLSGKASDTTYSVVIQPKWLMPPCKERWPPDKKTCSDILLTHTAGISRNMSGYATRASGAASSAPLATQMPAPEIPNLTKAALLQEANAMMWQCCHTLFLCTCILRSGAQPSLTVPENRQTRTFQLRTPSISKISKLLTNERPWNSRRSSRNLGARCSEKKPSDLHRMTVRFEPRHSGNYSCNSMGISAAERVQVLRARNDAGFETLLGSEVVTRPSRVRCLGVTLTSSASTESSARRHLTSAEILTDA